jgi:uncharacterized membrane-anchored protein
MTVALRILVIVALQTAALAYMIYDRISVFSSSTVVTLKVKPVDPSDMFRGDYVILTYDISMIATNDLPGDDKYVQGGFAYVTLEERDGAWTPTAVNSSMPAQAPGAVVIRGQVDGVMHNSGNEPPQLRLTYGIESFFVPQGQGKPIEDERQKGELTADIAVDAQGRGALRSLRRTDGTVMYVESLF